MLARALDHHFDRSVERLALRPDLAALLRTPDAEVSVKIPVEREQGLTLREAAYDLALTSVVEAQAHGR